MSDIDDLRATVEEAVATYRDRVKFGLSSRSGGAYPDRC